MPPAAPSPSTYSVLRPPLLTRILFDPPRSYRITAATAVSIVGATNKAEAQVINRLHRCSMGRSAPDVAMPVRSPCPLASHLPLPAYISSSVPRWA